MSSRVPKELQQAIKRDQRRWDSSMSWIIVTALGAFYEVDVAKPYLAIHKKRRQRRKKAA